MTKPRDSKLVDLDGEVELLEEPPHTKWRVMVGFGEERKVTFTELEGLFFSGGISEDTLIWGEGMVTWQRLGDLADRDPRFSAFAPDGLTVVQPFGPPPGLAMPEPTRRTSNPSRRSNSQQGLPVPPVRGWNAPAPWSQAPSGTAPARPPQPASDEAASIPPPTHRLPEKHLPPPAPSQVQAQNPAPNPRPATSWLPKVAWAVGGLMALLVILHRHEWLAPLTQPIGLKALDGLLDRTPIGASRYGTTRSVRRVVQTLRTDMQAPAKTHPAKTSGI